VFVDFFSVPVPEPIVRRISYFVQVCDRLKDAVAITEAYQFLEFAWEVWRTTELEDPVFQSNLWQKAFIMSRDHRLWDRALTSMLHLPNEETRKWALRTLAEALRRHGESERILSWNLPESLFDFYIHDLERLAYPHTPLLGTASLQCYNILYATFVMIGKYSDAAKVMYKMYCSLSRHLQQMPIADYIVAQSLNHVPGDSVSRHRDIPGAAEISTMMPLTHEGDNTDSLKIQRDALCLCSQALELMETPLIFMGGPVDVGATYGWSSSPMDVDDGISAKTDENRGPSLDNLRSMLANAKKQAKQVIINPERIKLELIWTEAKIALRGSSTTTSSPEEVIATLCSLGLVHQGLALAQALNIDTWTSVVKPFLRLCLLVDKHPKTICSITDAAAGPNLSSMFLRNDGCEPLAYNKDHVAAPLWESLREVCHRTGHSVDVANELLTLQPHEPLPGFILKALDNQWVTLLRLYMKHSDTEESLKLLEKKLGLQVQSTVKTLCPTQLCRQLYAAMKQNHDTDGIKRLVTICEDFTFLST